MQQSFIFRFVQNGLALFAALAVLAFSNWLWMLPNRIPAPDQPMLMMVEEEEPPADLGDGLTGHGAWRLVPQAKADMAGWSAAAFAAEGQLVILSDEGRHARIALSDLKPGLMDLAIEDLGQGPGPATRKQNRDSEALAATRDRGWLVAFEQHDVLWRYTADFQKGEEVARLSGIELASNGGIEGMTLREDGALWLFPEGGGTMAIWQGGKFAFRETRAIPQGVSDAASLPDGRLLLLSRRLGPRLVDNRLTLLDADLNPLKEWRLPLGPFDNMEGMAVEPLGPGRVRLWLISDNNGRGYVRTLIAALDLDL